MHLNLAEWINFEGWENDISGTYNPQILVQNWTLPSNFGSKNITRTTCIVPHSRFWFQYIFSFAKGDYFIRLHSDGRVGFADCWIKNSGIDALFVDEHREVFLYIADTIPIEFKPQYIESVKALELNQRGSAKIR